MQNNTPKTKSSTNKKIVGTIMLASGMVASAAAGYYFYGAGGKERRKKMTTWSKKAKTEMLDKIERMKMVSQKTYHTAVDEVLKKYNLIKNIDPKELQAFGQELKTHWQEISQEAIKLSNKGRVKKSKGNI